MITLTQYLWELALFALLLWREARGETIASKRVVAWTVRNRAMAPSWWGKGWADVITKRDQYSSMSYTGDLQLAKFPDERDTAWMACMDIANEVYNGQGADVSGGGTHYFDKSLDGTGKEPSWSKNGTMTHVMDSGNFHVFKKAA